MECKFLSNGIVIQYRNFLMPCCEWQASEEWITEHNVNTTKLISWHDHSDLVKAREMLANDQWPSGCTNCEKVESTGITYSPRLNGNNAYNDYQDSDITLEIRPGNVCNFACQTCWPFASSRVETYYKKADLPNTFSNVALNNFADYDFLTSVADRLRSIIVLGGEPFYDPKCLDFLQWANDNTTAEIMLFTNGSVVDVEFLKNFGRKITLVFSLDAIGVPSEYIRFGSEWDIVWNNYQIVQTIPNVNIRVNITTSPYNYYYLPDLLKLLSIDWPEIVTINPAWGDYFNEKIIPISLRNVIIEKLENSVTELSTANIHQDQKSNAINAVNSIIHNLKTLEYDPVQHENFIDFVSKMDLVKKVNFSDFCPEISNLLKIKTS